MKGDKQELEQVEFSGARLASTWELVGGLSIFICPVGYILTSKIFGDFIFLLVLWSLLIIGFGVIPLSVAAIIRAINENTLEIRKLNQHNKEQVK